jgi:putative MATE family efflux protein
MGGTKTTKDVDILLGDTRKAILAMSVPIALALLLQNTNSFVDTLWLAGLGSGALAATGIVYPMFSLLISVGTGLGIGASSAIAWSLGRRDKASADSAASQALFLSIIVGLVLTPVLFLVRDPVMLYMGAGDLLPLCVEYGTPLFASSVILVLHGMMTGIMRGEGAARKSTITLATAVVLNLIIDPIFIYSFGWGMGGAAWATVLATAVAVLISFLWYRPSGPMYLNLSVGLMRPTREVQKAILRVGLPETMELSIMNLMNVFLNAYVIVAGGADALAVWTSVWRFNNLMLVPAQGIAGAIVPVCAAAYGMRRFDRIKEGYRRSVKYALIVMTLLCVVVFVAADQVAMMFTYSAGSEYLRPEMAHFLRICCLFLPVLSLVFIGSSLLQSLGKATYAMLSTLVRNIALIAIFAFAAYVSLDAVWWGLFAGEFAGGLLMAALASMMLRSLIRKKGGMHNPV